MPEYSLNPTTMTPPKKANKKPSGLSIAAFILFTIGMLICAVLILLCTFVPAVLPALGIALTFLLSINKLGAIFSVAAIFGGPFLLLAAGLEVSDKVFPKEEKLSEPMLPLNISPNGIGTSAPINKLDSPDSPVPQSVTQPPSPHHSETVTPTHQNQNNQASLEENPSVPMLPLAGLNTHSSENETIVNNADTSGSQPLSATPSVTVAPMHQSQYNQPSQRKFSDLESVFGRLTPQP